MHRIEAHHKRIDTVDAFGGFCFRGLDVTGVVGVDAGVLNIPPQDRVSIVSYRLFFKD